MPEPTLIERVQTMRQRLFDRTTTVTEVHDLLTEVETALTDASTALEHADATMQAQDESRITRALSVLSYSESDALHHLLTELPPNGGLLVASQVADRVGITRSVIVNAVRKLQSAGVVEARSLGMKGTNIKFLNGYTAPMLLDALRGPRSRVA